MLTRQQLYEMYYSGPDVMLRYVENLLSHLAEVERHVGHRQQYSIDALAKRVKELMARVERLKTRLVKQEQLNDRLTRRVQELQAELVRRDREGWKCYRLMYAATHTTPACRHRLICQESKRRTR